MSAPEIIDVVNEAGEVVATMPRNLVERDNKITKNVLVFVFNSFGRVWVQLRAQSKTHFPGLWDISACGGVKSSETIEQAAHRETLEEMGITLELRHVESFLNVFPDDTGKEQKRLSYLCIGESHEQPQANEEVEVFKDWEPGELRADAIAQHDAYVPSFVVELDKAVAGYRRVLSTEPAWSITSPALKSKNLCPSPQQGL